jgi:hypothetical protein
MGIKCGTDMGIKFGTDMRIKCVILKSFNFSPHFYVSMFLRFYVLTSYTAISIKECMSLRQ